MDSNIHTWNIQNPPDFVKMARMVIDLLFTSKTPNIDQFDIFVFTAVVLWDIFELRLQILSTDSTKHEHCHIFLPDFFISYKSARNKFYFESDFEA